MPAPTLISVHDVTLDIGGIPILVRTDNADFAHLLEDRYGEFGTAGTATAVIEIEIKLIEPGLGVRNSELGARGSEFGIRDSELGPRTSDFGPGTPDSGLRTPETDEHDRDLSVRFESGRWMMERGDFRAGWNPETNRGWVRQTANPYSIDGVLRILHSLILAREGGFLVHAASAVRNGRAFVFAGASGAGKTTLARLAPPDVTLLTDEISYVRDTGYGTRDTGHATQEAGDRSQDLGFRIQNLGDRSWENRQSPIEDCKSQITDHKSQIANSQAPNPEPLIPRPGARVSCPVSRVPTFEAFGTPFAGELARIGQKVQAPLATLFLLKQGPENRIEALSEGQAARELLRHILFFAQDEELVGMVFQTVCDFVKQVPVRRLVFTPDARLWEMVD